MRRIVLTSAIVPMLTLSLLGLSSASHTTGGPGSQAGSYQVVVDCGGGSTVMPKTFRLACADGNDYLSDLDWASWRQGHATATGTQTMNDCTPSCAQGTFRSYRVGVVLSGNAAVTGHATRQRYATITLRYSGRPPSRYAGTRTIPGRPSVTARLWSS